VHVVRIEDPFLGGYYSLDLFEWVGLQLVKLTVGPLQLNAIRTESIHTGSGEASCLGLVEKPCQHNYVDGVVTPLLSMGPQLDEYEILLGTSDQILHFTFDEKEGEEEPPPDEDPPDDEGEPPED
jgi:hypothetical protein